MAAMDILKELEDLGLIGDPKVEEVVEVPPVPPVPSFRTVAPKPVPHTEFVMTVHPKLPEVVESFVTQLAQFEAALQGMLMWCEVARVQLTEVAPSSPVAPEPVIAVAPVPQVVGPTDSNDVSEESQEEEATGDEQEAEEESADVPETLPPLLNKFAVPVEPEDYPSDDPAAPGYVPEWNGSDIEEKPNV